MTEQAPGEGTLNPFEAEVTRSRELLDSGNYQEVNFSGIESAASAIKMSPLETYQLLGNLAGEAAGKAAEAGDPDAMKRLGDMHELYRNTAEALTPKTRATRARRPKSQNVGPSTGQAAG